MKKLIFIPIIFLLFGCTQGVGTPTTTGQAFGDSVKEQKAFKEVKFDDLIQCFQNKGSGVYYLGFEACPWCEDISPLIQQVSSSTKVDVRYINTKDKDNNSLISEDDKSLLMPYIRKNLKKDDAGNPVFYYPFVIVIKDGQILSSHIGTLEGHDAKERDLTIKEKTEIKSLLTRMLKGESIPVELDK